jgi:uncharacterized membrane protein YhaH (DUF805 family)
MNYILHALKNPFTYTGRASRAEFWSFVVFHLASVGALGLLSIVGAFLSGTLGMILFSLAAVAAGAGSLVLISLSVRRAHDFGLGGWLAAPMLLLPPVLLVCGLIDGHYRTNRYGPKPQALDF